MDIDQACIFFYRFRYSICDDRCEFAWHTFNLPLIFGKEYKTMYWSIINVNNPIMVIYSGDELFRNYYRFSYREYQAFEVEGLKRVLAFMCCI